MRRIKSEDDSNLSTVLVGAHKALVPFQNGNANLASGQSQPTPQALDSSAEWVDSDNGDLSLRQRVKSALLTTQDSIFVIAEIRNNRNGPVTILRPCGDHYEAVAGGIKIWTEKAKVKYTGPKWDYDLNKTAFTVLEAKAIVTETLELQVSDFVEIGKVGSYAVRYDYSYQGGWDDIVAKQGVKGVWHGSICSREVQVKRK